MEFSECPAILNEFVTLRLEGLVLWVCMGSRLRRYYKGCFEIRTFSRIPQELWQLSNRKIYFSIKYN